MADRVEWCILGYMILIETACQALSAMTDSQEEDACYDELAKMLDDSEDEGEDVE